MKDLNWILAFMAVVLIVLSPYLLEEITVRQNVQAWKEGRAWVANFVANWPDITADNFNIELISKDGTNVKYTASALSTLVDGELIILILLKNIEKDYSELRLRTLLELAPNGIATANMKGTLTYVNKAWENLTGFSKN